MQQALIVTTTISTRYSDVYSREFIIAQIYPLIGALLHLIIAGAFLPESPQFLRHAAEKDRQIELLHRAQESEAFYQMANWSGHRKVSRELDASARAMFVREATEG